MTVDTDPRPDVAEGGGRPIAWTRVLLVVGGVLALLLLGAAGGRLVGPAGFSDRPVPAADSVDVGFAQDMTVHHEQAVQMASWERDHSTDPVLRQLAFDIESTQTSQVGTMQGWLELWEAPALPVHGHMAWMSPSAGHTPGAGAVERMPGMATSEELRALRAADGRGLDVLFLQLMLRHHEGGAEMLRFAADHAAVPQVRDLAARMAGAQTTESEYLRLLLAERGGTPLPM